MLIICIAHLAVSNEAVVDVNTKGDVIAAAKTNGGGWVEGKVNGKNGEWDMNAGKTIYEGDNGRAKIGVGVSAHGRHGEVRDQQIGVNARWEF